MSWDVYRDVVPRKYCKAVTRRLWQEVRRVGLSSEDIADWSRTTFWPSLREEPEILQVREYLEGWRGPDQIWADTQILVRFPDDDDTYLGAPHIDVEPDWVDVGNYTYKNIFGVELTSTPPYGGSTAIHFSNGDVKVLSGLHAGDMVRMDPHQPHSGTPNMSGNVRMALFFRLLG